jgi:hypothetical protein
MRKLHWLIFIFLLACSSKADQPPKENVNTDYLVSLEGIGPLKTDMYQKDLEKVLNQKLPLTNPQDTISGSFMDSAFIKYKGADMRLTFERAYSSNDDITMRMTAIETSSPLCKTKEGIGIGSSKEEIINAFPENILVMNHAYANDTDTIVSKIHYIITVKQAKEGPQIIYRLKNNKVHSMVVGFFYDDEE